MRRPPQIWLLPDGRRLHLQDGPIDLIVGADGRADQVQAAYAAAARRFAGLLDELCAELPLLRSAVQPGSLVPTGPVARRMHEAALPFSDVFITPMAAVAGAVAEAVLGAMTGAAELDRAYVNNGGDIALHLAPGEAFHIGMIDRPDRPGLFGTATIHAADPGRGIATSGWRGRSFSLGIADAVTVLAATAAQADAAATIIANAVDLPGHPAVARQPAWDIQPDSDLGNLLVTRHVGGLLLGEIDEALARGEACAEQLVAAGLVAAAALHLQGATRTVGRLELTQASDAAPIPLPAGETSTARRPGEEASCAGAVPLTLPSPRRGEEDCNSLAPRRSTRLLHQRPTSSESHPHA